MNAPFRPLHRRPSGLRRLPLVAAVALGLVGVAAAPALARPGGKSAAGISSYQGTGSMESTSSPGRVAWNAEKARTARPAVVGGTTESVIGADTRSPVDNTSFPSRAVALILFDIPGGTASCSGALIGPQTVVTAGHCVAPGDNSGYYAASSFRVYPGANGSSAPFGGCFASAVFAPANWVVAGDTNFDYGAIKLACTIGNTVGWMGALVETAATLTGSPLRIVGYPADKPGTEWTSLGTIGATGTSILFYDNDTTAGMSGSPAYRFRAAGSAGCAGYCIKAIHTTGVGGLSPPLSTMNHGTRITQTVLNNLAVWINA